MADVTRVTSVDGLLSGLFRPEAPPQGQGSRQVAESYSNGERAAKVLIVIARPILEIYVVWHPEDELGTQAAEWLIDHFHGPAYAGLAGGAVEVYTRSAPWDHEGGPPRPLPFMTPSSMNLPAAQITAVVPVLGRQLARAVRDDLAWRGYMASVFSAGSEVAQAPRTTAAVGVYPLRAPRGDLSGTELERLAARPQSLPREAATSPATLARELSQAIAQRLHRDAEEAGEERITVFISHTKRHTATQRDTGPRLVAAVREVLETTRLGAFFDAHDIQVGQDWEARLDVEASRLALLMVRTDLYASREWTQREVLAAKVHDVPVVALYAVREQDDRGSFLMDHVPVIPCLPDEPRGAIERSLNRLVDEALKGALWRAQRVYAKSRGFEWLPAHAPEPVTVVPWLEGRGTDRNDHPVLIMHPDPPLGPRERDVIVGMCRLAGLTVDVVTPRTYAARVGEGSS